MNEVTVFNNEEFGKVRTLTIKNEPWFVLRDVCNALGITHITDTAKRLEEDEVGQTEVIDSMGRSQKTYIVNESGLYAVILRSDKPEAQKFRKWITSEVLPSIRKTGAYSFNGNDEYSKKSTSVGEVASLIKTLRSTMKDQKSKPRKIAAMAKRICDQFGIDLPDNFVEDKRESGQFVFPGFPDED